MPSSSKPYPSLDLAQKIITYYGCSFLLIFGILGNILNIIVFLRKRLRKTSCNNYFLASTFVNLIALSVGIIPLLYTYERPWIITTIYCKMRSYLYNASSQMSRYFIIMACFDRFTLCSTNIRLHRFCRVHIARYYAIPFIIIIWLIIPIHMLIFNVSINNNCVYPGVSALYNSIYGISSIGFLPPILMLIFSLLTFHNLKLRQQSRRIYPFIMRNTHLSTADNRKQERKDRQILGMLMIQVIAYISTTTITSINLLYSTVTTYSGISKSIERKSIEAFITFITIVLNFISPSLSCYLFLLISHLYRKQVKLLLLTIYRRYDFLRTGNQNANTGELIPVRQLTPRVTPIVQNVSLPM